MEIGKANWFARSTTEHSECANEIDERYRLWGGVSYDHEDDDGFSGDNFWPEEMDPQRFYDPVDRGFEYKSVND